LLLLIYCWTYFDPFPHFFHFPAEADQLTELTNSQHANFAGAKLKNFLAKREGRIAIFIEKTWLKSQFSQDFD
jgi:hypothetical protein